MNEPLNISEERRQVTKKLSDLALEYRLETRSAASKKRRLQAKHQVDFPGDTLFHRFSRTVCSSGCVNRKELFETWAVALHVQVHYPHAIRFCDVASGHGLLAWALLVLAEEEDQTGHRSAVCIDRHMPLSVDKLGAAILEEWPHLKDHFHYVEGRLEGLVPSPSTLIVGVHCCHSLSDAVIDLAIKGRSPLALVPCCHAKSCLNKDHRRIYQELKAEVSLTDFIDKQRILRLQEAGYEVTEDTIPPAYTGKNRLIVAKVAELQEEGRDGGAENPEWELPICQIVGADRKDYRQVGLFPIPLSTSQEAREVVRSLAGRAAADRRRHYQEATLGLAIFHPPDRFLDLDELEQSLSYEGSTIRTANEDGPYLHPQTGKHSQSYFVLYPGLTKAAAKEYHLDLCRRIPTDFPGAQMRQMPR